MMSTKDDSEDDDDDRADTVEDSSSDSEENFETLDGRESELNPEELEESQDTDDEIIELSDDNNSDHDSQLQERQETPTLRRSSRLAKPRGSNYITYKVSIEPTGVEPMNVQEALDSFYNKEWGLAMKEEFDALMQNKTWELCSPKGKKILKTRWVLK